MSVVSSPFPGVGEWRRLPPPHHHSLPQHIHVWCVFEPRERKSTDNGNQTQTNPQRKTDQTTNQNTEKCTIGHLSFVFYMAIQFDNFETKHKTSRRIWSLSYPHSKDNVCGPINVFRSQTTQEKSACMCFSMIGVMCWGFCETILFS